MSFAVVNDIRARDENTFYGLIGILYIHTINMVCDIQFKCYHIKNEKREREKERNKRMRGENTVKKTTQ